MLGGTSTLGTAMIRTAASARAPRRILEPRAVFETLAREGSLARADLAGQTGLSRAAVARALRMLVGAGAVVASGVGRVALDPALGYAGAVYADRRGVQVALVDPAGAVRAERHAPCDDPERRVEVIAALVRDCLSAVDAPLRLAVIGIPGAVGIDGSIQDDLGPDGGAVKAGLSAALGCPVAIENDVNLAALAELSAGGAPRSFALLMLADGLGAGIVIDGALHRGAAGIAGEVMYLPQTPLPIGAPVLCDAVVGDLALTLGRDPDATIDQHLEDAAQGDPVALEMAQEMGRRIALVAGTVALVVDPEVFVLSGSAAHPVLVDAVERVAASYAARLTLRFRVASFGAEAPLVGAVGEAASALRETVFTRILDAPDGAR